MEWGGGGQLLTASPPHTHTHPPDLPPAHRMRPRAGLASVPFPATASSLPELRKQFVCRRIVFYHPCQAALFCFFASYFPVNHRGAFRRPVLLEGIWMAALKPYFGKDRFPEPLQIAELCHCSEDRTQCGSSPHVGSGIIAADPVLAIAKPGVEQANGPQTKGLKGYPLSLRLGLAQSSSRRK